MEKKPFVCPWQAGNALATPMRRILHKPSIIMAPYLKKGMTAIDIGCGMGYFTLPMAELVGDNGNVIAADLQPQMLEGLKKNVSEAGILNITEHLCATNSLHIEQWTDAIDLALVFWMLHEVPDPKRLILEVRTSLKQNGKLLFVEPYVHVGSKAFKNSLHMITECGFTVVDTPKVAFSRTALL